MDKKLLEENIRHELNNILLICDSEVLAQYENCILNNQNKIPSESLKYYFSFSKESHEIMTKNLDISCELTLQGYFENPLSVLNNFDLCCSIAKFLKINYISLINKIMNEKTLNIANQSSFIKTMKIYEEKLSKDSYRKLSKLMLTILENNVDIDCFYDTSLFLISKKLYENESVNNIKLYIEGNLS
ncbi:hypothetical protein [Fluviispira multicolorata]|uniref:Uncharacterized protein n=1 Tax=Fluviispira multicolorata TaxID=2654512 RepID=A0A833JDX7_9BACT|nr:hypothetical protein [Fluviispira multicolorata]KAB8029145.1 hypothetical protein GCL57_11445 [Fluviispira multicolorata]